MRVPIGRLFVLVFVLLCLGVGLATLALSEEINHPEHYDAAPAARVVLAIDAMVSAVPPLASRSPSGRLPAFSPPPRLTPVARSPARLRAPPA